MLTTMRRPDSVPEENRPTRRSLALAVAALLVSVGVSACNTSQAATPPPSTTTTAPPGPPGITTVATLHATVPKYPAPGQPSDGTAPGSWYGYPSVLPVIAQSPGWVEVRLAQRPNQSTTWVHSSDVTLSSTPYRLVLTLSTRHLQLYNDNVLVGDFPAGIGTTVDPTPTGNYFIALKAPSYGSGYGPFELGTSAHSNVIASWDGSGDAITAIHGPITAQADSLIGTTGAQVSHGCIRLHYKDLAYFANVLPGSPLTIVP